MGLLTRGPNHQVAFTYGGVGTEIYRATRSGIVVTHNLSSSGLFQYGLNASYPSVGGLTTGPDGNLWVTDGASSAIVRVSGLDTPAGALDDRTRSKLAPDYETDRREFTNITANPHTAFAGIAKPGAVVILYAKSLGQKHYVEIGEAHASTFDGSWALASSRRLADGTYAVVATQKGDPRLPTVLYSLVPDSYDGTYPNALVIDTSQGARGPTPGAATVTRSHPTPVATLPLQHAAPGHQTRVK